MTDVLLIGVGHPDRGDDAIGPAIVRAVRAACPHGVRVLDAGGDLLGLLDVWTGVRGVILVDATRGTGPPGHVLRVALPGGVPDAVPALAPVSSHAFDLSRVLELGRTLGRMPRELVIYGVEGHQFGTGEALSPEVAAAVPDVTQQILAELSRLVTCPDPEANRAALTAG